jgi:hypothetical protein
VLLVQDTTTLNYTHHSTTTGLGPIAPATGQGFFLHTACCENTRHPLTRPEWRVPA